MKLKPLQIRDDDHLVAAQTRILYILLRDMSDMHPDRVILKQFVELYNWLYSQQLGGIDESLIVARIVIMFGFSRDKLREEHGIIIADSWTENIAKTFPSNKGSVHPLLVDEDDHVAAEKARLLCSLFWRAVETREEHPYYRAYVNLYTAVYENDNQTLDERSVLSLSDIYHFHSR